MKNWVPPDLGYSLQISAVSLQISAEFLSCFLKKQTKKKLERTNRTQNFASPPIPGRVGRGVPGPNGFFRTSLSPSRGNLGFWGNGRTKCTINECMSHGEIF